MNRSTYETRNDDFDKLSKLHKEYLTQITTSTKPEKVKARVGELREFVKKCDRLMWWLGLSGYWDSRDKYKKCAEMMAYWKTVAKIVTGVSL